MEKSDEKQAKLALWLWTKYLRETYSIINLGVWIAESL